MIYHDLSLSKLSNPLNNRRMKYVNKSWCDIIITVDHSYYPLRLFTILLYLGVVFQFRGHNACSWKSRGDMCCRKRILSRKKTLGLVSCPIGSMYGIYANIWGILMVNVAIYGIHGSYGCLFYFLLCNTKDFPHLSTIEPLSLMYLLSAFPDQTSPF